MTATLANLFARRTLGLAFGVAIVAVALAPLAQAAARIIL